MTTTEIDKPTDFDLPQEIEAEIQNYEARLRRVERDEIDPLEFRIFRLQHGIYGQRQADVHMVRVKIPFGGLSGDQIDLLAKIGARYAPRRMGHLTTREACGNTVRNVTADHLSGVGPDEAFDVTPYAKAGSDHCLRPAQVQRRPAHVRGLRGKQALQP
jgi:sulfite reductase (ferredoxin)